MIFCILKRVNVVSKRVRTAALPAGWTASLGDIAAPGPIPPSSRLALLPSVVDGRHEARAMCYTSSVFAVPNTAFVGTNKK